MSHPRDTDALYHCTCGEWHYKHESEHPPCEDQVTITLTKPGYEKIRDLFRLLVNVGEQAATNMLAKAAHPTKVVAPTYDEIISLYKAIISSIRPKIP